MHVFCFCDFNFIHHTVLLNTKRFTILFGSELRLVPHSLISCDVFYFGVNSWFCVTWLSEWPSVFAIKFGELCSFLSSLFKKKKGSSCMIMVIKLFSFAICLLNFSLCFSNFTLFWKQIDWILSIRSIFFLLSVKTELNYLKKQVICNNGRNVW